MSEQAKNKITYRAKHWFIILYSIVLLFFLTGLTVDGLNAIVPGLAALRGWNPNDILSMSTPATLIALFVTMFFGKIIDKLGLKTTTIASLVIGGLATIWYGQANSLTSYAISLTLMITFINAFAIICGFTITAQWFPRTKGYVMGITTIGMNLASALIVPILKGLSYTFNSNPGGNISVSLTILGIVMILISLYTKFFVKVTPEDAGELPDNRPYDESLDSGEVDKTKLLTYRQIFSKPQTWLTGFSDGCFGMATVGIMSQLVPFFISKGFSEAQAIGTLSMAAIIGIAGSYLWGIIDQKIGTKKAQVYFGIFYAVGIILLTMQNSLMMYTGLVLLGMGIGGNGNFPPSMTTSLFGRADFANSYSIINGLVGFVRSFAFVLLAIILSKTNSNYIVAYYIFAAIAFLGSVISLFIKVPNKPGQI